jgi:hypothetical protein
MRILLLSLPLMVAATSAVAEEWRTRALSDIKEQEKAVIAIRFMQPRILIATAKADAENISELPEDLCLGLLRNGMPLGEEVIVRVFDAEAMARREHKELGHFTCFNATVQ